MINKYKNLNLHYKAAIWTFAFNLLFFLVTLFGFFTGYRDIPLGALLGGVYGTIVYVVLGFLDNKEHSKDSVKVLVISLILRFVLFAGLLVMVAIFTYKKGWKIFNIFTFVGAYLSSTVILLLINIVDARRQMKIEEENKKKALEELNKNKESE